MLLIFSYLLGSIPSAIWIGKWFYQKDIREFGSGNAGATNTFRVLGKKAGIPVLILDVLKGFMAVQLAYSPLGIPPGSEAFINLKIILGISAFLGHLFPVFAEFRGGKGVATLLGACLAISWEPTLMSLGVFVILLLTTGYVSLGSIGASLFYPFSVIVINQTEYPTMVVYSMLIAFLLLITHQKNIERLLKKQEGRIFSPGRKRMA
ncbi:MAG: glycerol-3-phosphate 1-O-acyltransferase PlsY [Bacteroidota bacterium]